MNSLHSPKNYVNILKTNSSLEERRNSQQHSPWYQRFNSPPHDSRTSLLLVAKVTHDTCFSNRRIENGLFHWNLFLSNASDGIHRNDFLTSLSRIENELFRWNLFVSNGSVCLHLNAFLSPHPTWVEFFLSLSRIKNIPFHRNQFVSNGSDGLHRNDFLPPNPTCTCVDFF